jgi:hypothetical protein
MLVISKLLAYMREGLDRTKVLLADATPVVLPLFNTNLNPLFNVFAVVPYYCQGRKHILEGTVNFDISIVEAVGVSNSRLGNTVPSR